MNATILNRGFKHPTDGWYHIEPIGEHPNRQAGVVQVIDPEAVRAIVNRFNSEAEQHGSDFPGMLIDHEHFSHDQDKATTAYGWLMRLQNRANDPQKPGIYGQVNWTGTGKAAVDGGDYRFFSTEYDPDDLSIVNRVGDRSRFRPLRISGLSLTNRPNNKGQRPITNSDRRSGDRREEERLWDAIAVRNRAEELLKSSGGFVTASMAFEAAKRELLSNGQEEREAAAVCNRALLHSGESFRTAFNVERGQVAQSEDHADDGQAASAGQATDPSHTRPFHIAEPGRSQLVAKHAARLMKMNPALSLSGAFRAVDQRLYELENQPHQGGASGQIRGLHIVKALNESW